MPGPESLGATDSAIEWSAGCLLQGKAVNFAGRSQAQGLDLPFPVGKLLNFVGRILFSLRPGLLTRHVTVIKFLYSLKIK